MIVKAFMVVGFGVDIISESISYFISQLVQTKVDLLYDIPFAFGKLVGGNSKREFNGGDSGARLVRNQLHARHCFLFFYLCN
ncbi:unnamed protein product [Citrullus colocynthis]|uniref:Uncharacterized protein n=1 Tax=Citrullus colocynthis TaxID=252529 RepID=A0ABP0Y7Y2_9ROSI